MLLTEPRTLNRLLVSEYFVLALCGLTFVVFAPFAPGFASPQNLWNILISCLPLLMLATGQTVVLITAGIDLSVTAIIGFSSLVRALPMGGAQFPFASQPAPISATMSGMLS